MQIGILMCQYVINILYYFNIVNPGKLGHEGLNKE